MNEISERVEFPRGGTAVTVQLSYGTGKQMTSTGNYLYSLQDGRHMFATPILNQKIQELEPNQGARISIQLTPNREWIVRKAEGPAASRSGMEAPASSQTANHYNTGLSNLTKEQILAAMSPEEKKTVLGLVLTGEANGNRNGNGRSNGAPPNGDDYGKPVPGAPNRPATSLMNGQAQGRLQHLNDAVDLCIATKNYARECGLALEIRFEDVRTVATSLAISAEKNGGR